MAWKPPIGAPPGFQARDPGPGWSSYGGILASQGGLGDSKLSKCLHCHEWWRGPRPEHGSGCPAGQLPESLYPDWSPREGSFSGTEVLKCSRCIYQFVNVWLAPGLVHVVCSPCGGPIRTYRRADSTLLMKKVRCPSLQTSPSLCHPLQVRVVGPTLETTCKGCGSLPLIKIILC